MKRKREFAITFLILFPFWLVLSGRFDPFHLSLGIISCGIVALFSGDLLISSLGEGNRLKVTKGFLQYLPWLFLQIFLSSLHMLRLALHPRMKELIDPRVVRFKSSLKDELALVTFANSITLTPGTITVFVDLDGEFRVHAIDGKCAEALPGEMERRVGAIFGEK